MRLDLHDIFSSGDKIERAVDDLFEEAIEHKKKMIEIITGKGSGQLKKSILRYIEKKYKGQYARIEKDDKNWGRIFVHFRWK